MLLRHGNNFGIVYATHIPSQGFQRFSISHELGHFFLDGHLDQLLKDGVHVSRAGFVTADPYELEADHFAAGLLMPEAPFRKAMDRYDPGLDAIEAVADLCLTSRTATAIRYAELTDAAVAVIMSTGGIIDYCFLSEAMKIAAEARLAAQGHAVAGRHGNQPSRRAARCASLPANASPTPSMCATGLAERRKRKSPKNPSASANTARY